MGTDFYCSGSYAELAESGVTDGLVRVSVGIEDWRNLPAAALPNLATTALTTWW